MDPASTPRDSAIEFVLNGHTRSVTDVNWSIFDPDVVATCALDSWVMTWDMRTGGKKPASSYSGWRGALFILVSGRRCPMTNAQPARRRSSGIDRIRTCSLPLMTVESSSGTSGRV